MIKKYSESMDFIVDLFKEIFNTKQTSKITFKMYNETFDMDFAEESYQNDKLLNRLDEICKKNKKLRYPAAMFLFMRESFEYFIKYEDKYNDVRGALVKSKDLYKVIQNLKEDMWPFYPFFQEALVLFSSLVDPDYFSTGATPDFVYETMIRETAFIDSDGDVAQLEMASFFFKVEDFYLTAQEIIDELPALKSKSLSFSEVIEIKNRIDLKFRVFNLGFVSNYNSFYQFALMQYDKINSFLNNSSLAVFNKELVSFNKFITAKYNDYSFSIKSSRRLEELDKYNDMVYELKETAISKYNGYVDFINAMGIDLPPEFDQISKMVVESDVGSIDHLYELIDAQTQTIEIRFEEKKRLRDIRDISIRIKNFDEFLIGIKTELGDFNHITKKQIGNLESKADAELFQKRIKIQKENYFKHVRVFDYITMTQGIEQTTFKIYTRSDFSKITTLLREIERFLNMVLESILPEVSKKEESDFENEGRIVNIDGNDIKIALMNEDFSELSFGDDNDVNSFNIHDYSAYHNLVDYAVNVRKQPVFQDYGDISEYPYFKPFKYQVDSVRTMLGRFEGRGVFGDQVGLGKTLEALMTADVMFRCATIRNAVIVTTKQTIHQWRNECNTKFRHEDGSPMFEVYPKHDSYSFIDLIKELKKDKASKNSNALKVYLVSTEQIKSNETIEFIKSSSEYFELKNAAYNKNPYVPTDINVTDVDLSKIICIKHLDILKKRLPKELSRVIKESLSQNETYQKLTSYNVYGFFTYEFDEQKKVFIPTNDKLYDKKNKDESPVLREVNLLKEYSKCLAKIEERKKQIIEKIDKMSQDNMYADQRLIDLLIFDEVQDLLIDFNKKGNKEEILQEFIANIQKKYCILISATPIRNDLSDIFNLLYMVDKNRLGETKELAESKFYNAYCGGARSLSEMAASPEAYKKFTKLNGLINSMFTRKRLYDADVVDSIRRHCATPAEYENAKYHNRDDYGGAAFIRLIGIIRRAKELSTMNQEDSNSFIDKFVRPLFSGYNLSSEVLKDAFVSMSDLVDHSVKICMMRLEYQMRMKLQSLNIYDKFIENYKIIQKAEAEDNKDEIYYTAIRTCNLLCSYINRGLMAFYKSHHDYPTVFLSDYIDWRRPRKQGESIEIKSDEQKLDILKDLLIVSDDKYKKSTISVEKLRALENSKALVYERQPELRNALYKNIRANENAFGVARRVYMNLFQSEEDSYTLEDFIHFGYFPKGTKNAQMKQLMRKFSEDSNLTFDQQRMIDTYTLNGTLKRADSNADTFKDINFKWFTEFTSENENWNSIYFLDKTMLAGTDFNAANLLIIGQLDKVNGDYMDPLELEQLIGRVSRMGQTEECLVLTCLTNGNNNDDINYEFNKAYYEILTDEEGFDLYGVCQTEVDFVTPVIMAVAKRLFSREHSYVLSQEESDNAEVIKAFNADRSDFKALYKNEYIDCDIKRFPDIIRYAFDNNENITVSFSGNEYKPLEAIKQMIRLYSKVLRNDIKEK